MRSAVARAAAVALVIAAATACSGSGDHAAAPTPTSAGDSAAPGTSAAAGAVVEVEAAAPLGRDGLLVAGRAPHGRRTRLWHCPALTAISRCRPIPLPGLAPAEYVDDLAVWGRATYWVLTSDVDRQRSHVHLTTDGGRSWATRPAPARGLAAGSRGTIQAFGESQALLSQYWSNGPFMAQYLTDDAARTWQQLGEIDLG